MKRLLQCNKRKSCKKFEENLGQVVEQEQNLCNEMDALREFTFYMTFREFTFYMTLREFTFYMTLREFTFYMTLREFTFYMTGLAHVEDVWLL